MATLHLDERVLNRKELSEAALVANRAFFDDPFYKFLSNDDNLRSRGLTIFFRAMLKHLGKGGRIITVRDEHDKILGVSAWLPTDCYPQSIGTQLAQSPGTIRALYRRPKALLHGNAYLSAIAKAHPKEPHWYLFLLVADPSVQRSGIGTMLVEHGLAMADLEGVGSYLETQNYDNVAYYQRFGYELVQTLSPVPSGPPLLAMWKRPR